MPAQEPPHPKGKDPFIGGLLSDDFEPRTDPASVVTEDYDPPPIEKTGTDGCACCTHPEHDALIWAFWRGDISSKTVSEKFGISSDGVTLHIRRHIPNYHLLRYQAKVVGGPEAMRLLIELRSEAEQATDPFGRVFLLRQNIGVLRGTQIALTKGGFRTDPNHVHALRGIAEAISKTAKELQDAEIKAAELASLLREEERGTGWEELRRFQETMAEALHDYPEAWAAVMERFRVDSAVAEVAKGDVSE